jgi:hypothetical protein
MKLYLDNKLLQNELTIIDAQFEDSKQLRILSSIYLQHVKDGRETLPYFVYTSAPCIAF